MAMTAAFGDDAGRVGAPKGLLRHGLPPNGECSRTTREFNRVKESGGNGG
jgi:hypothetical protein